jgi:prepilin-type N-terminal cleavage/methylation domain-containing protein
MKTESKTRDNLVFFTGFTLFELVVVLAIISAMVAVVLPFCKRSNDSLKVKQHSSNIAQSLRYACDLAEKRNKAVKFIFDEKQRSYHLQIEGSENSFEPLDDFTGTEQFLDEGIQVADTEGFEQAGSEYTLVFDPQKLWPDASIKLSTKDLTVQIRVKSKYVDIQEEGI